MYESQDTRFVNQMNISISCSSIDMSYYISYRFKHTPTRTLKISDLSIGTSPRSLTTPSSSQRARPGSQSMSMSLSGGDQHLGVSENVVYP